MILAPAGSKPVDAITASTVPTALIAGRAVVAGVTLYPSIPLLGSRLWWRSLRTR
ncbi:MAG: hypothetical protein ACREC5_00590 [Thermoplasmata archaeon]